MRTEEHFGQFASKKIPMINVTNVFSTGVLTFEKIFCFVDFFIKLENELSIRFKYQ